VHSATCFYRRLCRLPPALQRETLLPAGDPVSPGGSVHSIGTDLCLKHTFSCLFPPFLSVFSDFFYMPVHSSCYLYPIHGEHTRSG
jgi:hypothetical protein